MRKLLAPVAAVGLVLAMVGTVLAWVTPILTSECAPDANHFAWKINLAADETDYIIDWSFDSGFAGATTVNFLSSGDKSFTTPNGPGTTLYVRWSSDHTVTTQAAANTALCVPPSVEQSIAASVEQSIPASVEQSIPASVEQSIPASGEQSIKAGTGTPAPSTPNTALVGNGSSPLPTIIFGMVLLASLGTLAYTNMKVARAPRRNR